MPDGPTPRSEHLREEIGKRALAVEPNEQVPGQPTLTGLVAAMLNEIAELKERVERLES